MKYLNPPKTLAVIFSLLLLISSCASSEPASETESVPVETAAIVSDIYGISSIRKLTDEEMEKYPQKNNIPSLYIETEKDFMRIQKGTYVDGIYTLVSDGEGIIEMPINVKGRGNYSWSFPQKPYTIKLDTAEPLLGLDQGRKWVLVTTYSDKTLLRNYLTLNLSSRLLGMKYAVEAEFVELYMNREYRGLYVLSEKAALGVNRCEADALFEIEAQYRHDDCRACIICPSGCHIMFKEPYNDLTSAKERNTLMSEYSELIKSADRAMADGSDEYLDYIDVDSFVDWYIINEFVKNFDSGFTTSCYFCVKDGKLYMGPCWDYDTCMGNQIVAECVNPVGYHVANSPWYSMLIKDDYFVSALHARWTQLWDDGVFEQFVNMIDGTAEIISEAEKRDHAKYPTALTNHDLRGDLSRETWEDELDYLKDWVNKRLEWLNSEWHE